MFAVSAIHTNRGAAAALAKRKERTERIKQHIADSTRAEQERQEAERLAQLRYRKILSAYREVEFGGGVGRLSIKAIVTNAIEGTPFTLSDIRSPRRGRELTDVRHYAYLCAWAQRTDLSLPELGQQLGDRDHTTILYAKKRFGFSSRAEAATFIRMHGREATLARLVKRAA